MNIFVFEYLFTFLKFDENLKYEYMNSFLTIQKNVMLTVDLNVVEKIQNSKMFDQFQKTDDENAIENEKASDTKKIFDTKKSILIVFEIADSTKVLKLRFKIFFAKKTAFFKKKSLFQNLFSSDQHKEMLHFHDQFDVFTQQKLLD